MVSKLFDLNIEEILDNWELHHAVREIIANALDEQLLTGTAPITISKDLQGNWYIRDFGRGIQIEHFTMNENPEKLNGPEGIIGKFGVGLKDALATFNRHGVQIAIQSQYGLFMLKAAQKHGFNDIVTLHIQYDDSPIKITGTRVALKGVSDADISRARDLFMVFSNETVIETTEYGQIIQRKEGSARVYINGVLASEEPNFLFSYNITSLTEAMRKRLNRERLNVGRTTYTDRVKAILRTAASEKVHGLLADQVDLRSRGDQCDEMQWLEVSQLAFNYLSQRRQVVFVTEQEVYHRPEIVDNLREDGYAPVLVSDAHKEKIEKQAQAGGPELRTMELYVQEFNQSFQYKFIEPHQLNAAERLVFDLSPKLLALVGVSIASLPVKVSETIRLTMDNTAGVWDPRVGAIVILRSQLRNPVDFAGILLHEVVHARTHLPDVSRNFESALTNYLGIVAIAAVKNI